MSRAGDDCPVCGDMLQDYRWGWRNGEPRIRVACPTCNSRKSQAWNVANRETYNQRRRDRRARGARG